MSARGNGARGRSTHRPTTRTVSVSTPPKTLRVTGGRSPNRSPMSRPRTGAAPPAEPHRLQLRVERVAGSGLPRLVAHGEPVLALSGGAVCPRLRVDLATSPALNPVVADRRGGVERRVDVCLRQPDDEAGLLRVAAPHAGIAVGLELGAHRAALSSRLA